MSLNPRSFFIRSPAQVTNKTLYEKSDLATLDILPVLKDYGGFPGQQDGLQWQPKDAAGGQQRWAYEYGYVPATPRMRSSCNSITMQVMQLLQSCCKVSEAMSKGSVAQLPQIRKFTRHYV